MLTDAEAKKLSRTKVLCVAVTMVTTVWLVLNSSLPAAVASGFFSALLFKASELVSMPEATATEKVIFAIKAFVAQVLSTIFFVSMMFPAMAARF